MRKIVANAKTGHVGEDVVPKERMDEYAVEADPLDEWKARMVELDGKLPRFLEDIMDAVGIENFPEFWKEIYAEKKQARSERDASS